jgi:hypothetical protein
MEDILSIPTKKLFPQYIDIVSKFHSFDVKRIEALANKISKRSTEGYELQDRWYRSIRRGEPDYSVYGADEYIADAWSSWADCSRKHLINIMNDKSFPDHRSARSVFIGVNKIIDAGCGFAFSTIALKQMFPHARVIGTNLPGTLQYKVDEHLSKIHNFEMVDDVDKVGRSDMVFCSEYFEHFEAPIEHLKHVIMNTRPKIIVVANAFGTIGVGHFERYRVGKNLFNGRNTSKKFNDALRMNGYNKLNTKIWNQRPTIWVKGGRK